MQDTAITKKIFEHFENIAEAAEFWDTHSLADYEEYLSDVENVHIDSRGVILPTARNCAFRLNKEILRCALLDFQETTRNEFMVLISVKFLGKFCVITKCVRKSSISAFIR